MRVRTSAALAAVLVCTGVTLAPHAQAADSGKIVYGSGGHVFMMNADGSNQVDLTPGWTGFAANPSLSPDGTQVALSTNPGQTSGEIYVIPSSPTAQSAATRLTNDGVVDQDPVWSPDGTKIAWTHDTPSTGVPRNYEIWTMNADGTNKQRLTNDIDGDYDFEPTWSPDGTKIAWSSTREGYGCNDGEVFIAFNQIHVMPSGGGAESNNTDDLTKDAGNPDWSPDGSKIAFDEVDHTLIPASGGRYDCGSESAQAVWSGSASGGAATVLNTGFAPSWSPDGSRLVLNASLGGPLAVMDADGDNFASLGVSGSFADWGQVGAAKTPTTTTVKATKHGKSVDASGSVAPAAPGESVTVTLARKKHHKFRTVATKTAVQGDTGAYASTFARARRGSCRFVTQYAGDATHAASSRTVSFRC